MGVFLLTVVLSFGPAFGYAAILYWLDRFEKEPRRMLIGSFLWGAFIATFGAIVWSSIFEASLLAITGDEMLVEVSGATVVAPLVEESLKGAAVLIIFLAFRHEFDSILDGIVYAGITALGFAATENVLYLFFSGYSEDGMGGLIALFILRVIMGGWGHAVYTSFIGIGLAMARLSRNRLVQFGAPVLGWCVAVGLHALHNGMATFLASQGLGGLGATLLVDWTSWLFALGIIVWAIRREHTWMAQHLQDEVAQGVISQAQYNKVCSMRGQIQAQLSGVQGRRFYQLCAELAQKKHQFSIHGDEHGNTARIAALRNDLSRLASQVA